MPTFADARALAELVLADHLPERWRRTQAVAREALRLADLPDVDRDALIQAAVLADVGASPVVARTGVAPADGARFLAVRGFDRRVVDLVARRDGPPGLAATRDALHYCDAVVGTGGEPEPSPDLADPTLRAAVERTRARMSAAGIPPSTQETRR